MERNVLHRAVTRVRALGAGRTGGAGGIQEAPRRAVDCAAAATDELGPLPAARLAFRLSVCPFGNGARRMSRARETRAARTSVVGSLLVGAVRAGQALVVVAQVAARAAFPAPVADRDASLRVTLRAQHAVGFRSAPRTIGSTWSRRHGRAEGARVGSFARKTTRRALLARGRRRLARAGRALGACPGGPAPVGRPAWPTRGAAGSAGRTGSAWPAGSASRSRGVRERPRRARSAVCSSYAGNPSGGACNTGRGFRVGRFASRAAAALAAACRGSHLAGDAGHAVGAVGTWRGSHRARLTARPAGAPGRVKAGSARGTAVLGRSRDVPT